MGASSGSSPVAPRTRVGIYAGKLAHSGLFFWSCLALLVVLGALGLSQQFISLWEVWTTDPLRSIGMVITATSIVLVLGVWWQNRWELRGTWWGLLPLAMAFFSIVFSQKLIFTWDAGLLRVNFVTNVLPIYLYACGIVLLFAGLRVWRQSWFPLALLLCAQPVPSAVVTLLDLPLQSRSAQIARSFALLIGFPPTNPELLRLMFTPDFGMFIAPGCDGMRGAIALGYIALIVGYLKRVSFVRWFLYVSGAVLLGHLFNLLRLCALVLYYRIAVGNHALESMAKQADYAIGGVLFLVAVLLFLWVAFRKDNKPKVMTNVSADRDTAEAGRQPPVFRKLATFALLVLIVIVPGVHAIQNRRESLAASIRDGKVTLNDLNDRVPKQLGDYRLTRTWQEQLGSLTAIENAAYKADALNEIDLGIWLLPGEHTVHRSWLTHGEVPETRTTASFVTVRGQTASFDTAFYSDGVTDSLTADMFCTPSLCLSSPENEDGVHLGLTKAIDFSTRGVRAVPIYFIIQAPHKDAPDAAIQKEMLTDCQNFLRNIDLNDLSKRFQ